MIQMRLSRSSRKAVVDAITYSIVITLFLLFFGRFLGLPVFLAAIVSPSMEPAIKVGDIVAVQRGAPYGVGDVIMWCSSPFFCVVHRVVEVGRGYVVTKGDSNPVPDLPVPASAVVGKVVAVFPREAVVLIVSLVAIAILIKKGAVIFRPSDPMSLMVYGLIAFIGLSLATLFFFPAPSVFEVGEFRRPNVTMRSATYVNGTVVLEYNMVDTWLEGIRFCGVSAQAMHQMLCEGARIIGGNEVVVRVPPSFLERLNEEGVRGFRLRIVASLAGNGSLEGDYPIIFSASKLLISVVNGSLIIENPNPFPIPYNLTVSYFDGRRWESNVTVGRLGGFDRQVIRGTEWERVWFELDYVLMGEVVKEAGWVRGG